MEWLVSKVQELGIDVNTVDFERLDWDVAREGDIHYIPDKNCIKCKGTGRMLLDPALPFPGQPIDQVPCICTDVSICGWCRGTGEVSEDVITDGNTEKGVGTRKCVCQKKGDTDE